jgi:hypothetical protein
VLSLSFYKLGRDSEDLIAGGLLKVELALFPFAEGINYFYSSRVIGSSFSFFKGRGGKLTFFLTTRAS